MTAFVGDVDFFSAAILSREGDNQPCFRRQFIIRRQLIHQMLGLLKMYLLLQCQAAIVDSLQGAAKEQIVFSYCVSMNSDVVIHITQIGNIP